MGIEVASTGASSLFYVELHDILENKSDSYLDDIIAKEEKYFLPLLFEILKQIKIDHIESKLDELKSFLIFMALPFFKLEVKEKFLFIKTIIPFLEKIKINKNKIQTYNFDDAVNSLGKDKCETITKELFEDFNQENDAIKEKYKGYCLCCSSIIISILYPNLYESDLSIYYYLFEYIEYNLQKANISKDEEINKEIKNLMYYLQNLASKNKEKIFELIIFYLKAYLKNYEFTDEKSLLQFEKKVLEEDLDINNFIILLRKNIYDFKYSIECFIEKKKKDNSNSIHLYEPTKVLIKNRYINAIIFENVFTKKEILILKINLENYIRRECNIVKILEDISENFNIFKKYEKIYVSFDNKFFYFNNDIKENKYKLLKDEISDSICKIKLKEDIKSEESQYQELIEKMDKKLNDYSLEKTKKIEKKKKYYAKRKIT